MVGSPLAGSGWLWSVVEVGCGGWWLLAAARGCSRLLAPVVFVLPPLCGGVCFLGGGVVCVVGGVEVGSACGWVVVRPPLGASRTVVLRLAGWLCLAGSRGAAVAALSCLGRLTWPRAQVALDSSQSHFFVVCKSAEKPCGACVSGWPRVLAILVSVMESIRWLVEGVPAPVEDRRGWPLRVAG